MGWTQFAKAAVLGRTFDAKWEAKIDVEYAGSYGVNIVDITGRVLDWGQPERATSACDKDWSIQPITIKCQNHDGYLTPNFFSGRDLINNVWRVRPSGEASYRACRLYIDLNIFTTLGTWETLRVFKGAIAELNLIDDAGQGPIAEIVAKEMLVDALDRTFTLTDGASDTAVAS